MLRTEHRFWHPAGVRLLTVPEPGVSLRSTPGYLLASLQDVSGRLLRLLATSGPRRAAGTADALPATPEGRTKEEEKLIAAATVMVSGIQGIP